MRKAFAAFVALFVYIAAFGVAPASARTSADGFGQATSKTSELAKSKKKKKCKKLKKKIKKAKSKKAKKKAKKKYNKKCKSKSKCKKLKKKIKKARSKKKRKKAKKKFKKQCKGGSGGGGSGGGGGGGGSGGGGGGSGGGGGGGGGGGTGTKTERKAEQTYVIPALGVGDPANTGACPNATNSCGIFPVGAEEHYVSIAIADMSTLPVGFSVGQDTDPDAVGTETDLGNFCGETEAPIQFQPGYDIVVFPWFIGGPGCPGIATTGTVTATFSNIP